MLGLNFNRPDPSKFARSGRRIRLERAVVVLIFLSCAALAGCAGSQKQSVTEAFYDKPGNYPPAPLNEARARVGLPAPVTEVSAGAAAGDQLESDAADQLLWVADHCGRFNLIERERLGELMSQQGLNGMLVNGRLVHPAALHGVRYLLLCHIRGLSIRGGEQPTTVSVANAERLLHISKPTPRITTIAVVEMRLVDPGTGAIAAQGEDHFNRVCSAEAMELSFPSADSQWGELHLNDEQMEHVLRIVLDDCMRKFLPQVDAVLTQPGVIASVSTPPDAPTTGRAGKTTPGAAKIPCPECGFECSADDEFCPNCGTRLLQNGVRIKSGGK